jgi:hypothetical protein
MGKWGAYFGRAPHCGPTLPYISDDERNKMTDSTTTPATTGAITTPVDSDVQGDATFTSDAPDTTDVDQAGGPL